LPPFVLVHEVSVPAFLAHQAVTDWFVGEGNVLGSNVDLLVIMVTVPEKTRRHVKGEVRATC